MQAKTESVPSYVQGNNGLKHQQNSISMTVRGYALYKKICECLDAKYPGRKVVRARVIESLLEAEAKRLGLSTD